MQERLDIPQNVLYEGQPCTLVGTRVFATWVASLADVRAKAKILDRVRRAGDGNFGDGKSVGDGVFEMRIDYGPGYRIYYFKREQQLVVLLSGGTKKSQRRDIAEAIRLKEEIEQGGGGHTL